MAGKVQELIAIVSELESGKYVIPGRVGDTGKLQKEHQQKARKTALLMRETFNEDELRDLCMVFALNYEDVKGDTRVVKINNLVDFFYRRNTLDMFINFLSGERPNVQWPHTEIPPHG